MNDQVGSPGLPATTRQLPAEALPPPVRPQRFARMRAWLRSRVGRIAVPLIALLLGIVIGVVALLLIGLSGQGQTVATPAAGQSDLVVEVERAFLTNLVIQNLRKSGMPGTIENVNVTLAQGDQFTINGDDTFGVLGIGLTKHFTVVVQPYIRTCVLQIHVVSANLSGIPVTGFVQSFESSINQQLQQKPTGLPSGFQYCTTSVRTQPDGIFMTYSATPIAMRNDSWLV